tara:strand:- start:1023 stop:1289 length:267 start_codon:yes stop_codon:yes gene_type:complete
MKRCSCGSCNFVAVVPNAIIEINILGANNFNSEEEDKEIIWTHKHLEESINNDIAIKCKICNKIFFAKPQEIGLQATQKHMVFESDFT